MSQLTASNALSQVELALKNTILLAVGQRIGPTGANVAWATTTALKVLPQAGIRNDELAFVSSKGFTYQFDRFSSLADDGNLVIAPTDAAATGRWIQTTSTVSSGYAKQVRIHTGREEYSLMLAKANATRPSIHILFDQVRSYNRSLSIGALYQMAADYKIRSISSNLRGGSQGVDGSFVPSETDPGTHQMCGDIIAAVAGSQLNQTGVVYSQIDGERVVESPEEGRLIVEEIRATVFYTVHQPDIDSVVLDSLGGLTIQRKLLGGGSPYDSNNVVTLGYTIPIGSGFAKTPVTGTAVIGGAVVSSSPTSHTFSANSDTYRDLHTDGTFSYTTVANGGPAPALVYTGPLANTLRVGVTVTDGSGIIYDAMLASSLINFQAVDILPGAGIGVSSIAITPSSASFSSGQTQKFVATATCVDSHTLDISTVVTWVSSNLTVATIDYTGKTTWVGVGSSTISCSYDGLAGGNTAALTGT